MKYIEKQEDGTTKMDRFAWDIGPALLNYPEIGETISVVGAASETTLKKLYFSGPDYYLDIDWEDLFIEEFDNPMNNMPEVYETTYFKNGKICREQWWCWKFENLQEEERGPQPQGPVEEWYLGKTDAVTINRKGELIWRTTVLQALDQDSCYPPVIQTTCTCKGTKVDL